MAVIRCQACGKPNPDFLEECQFCDARLKPLTGMLTPSPNALPPLAPMTPPAPEPAPASNTHIIKCQACGKPNPAFLDTCQFCDARLKPLTAELRLPDDSPAAATEWLISTRAQPAETPAQTLPDWLQAMDSSPAEPSMAMPEPEPAADIPEWMRGEAEPAAPADIPDWMRASAPAPAASEEDVPDWLKAMQSPTAEPAPDWMSSTEATPATPATPASTTDDEMPDWLRAMQSPAAPTPAASAAAAAATDVPEWMRASAEPAPTAAETPSWMSAAPEPASAEEDVPDWLRAMQAPSAPSAPTPAVNVAAEAPAEPDWMSAPSTPSAPAQPAAEEVPDWLQAMRAPTSTPPTSEPEPTEDITTDWLVSTRAPQPETPVSEAADMPDWLRAMEPSASQPLAMTEPPASTPAADEAEVPDWMRSAASASDEPAAAATPASDLPDWMSALGGATAVAATESQPDWMQSSGPSAESTPALTDDGMPDWLKAMQSSAATPAVPGVGETPGGDMPDWMTTMENAPTQAALPPVSTDMVLPDDAPDWLKSMQGTGELGTLQSASAASESQIPSTEAGGDWLSALRGSAAELEPLPISEAPTVSSYEGAPPSDRSVSGGLEEAALPSWLAAMKPIDVQAAPLDEEADVYEERVGVLAGMRGVLRAEPVVALPRKSTVQVHKLEVTADQTRQANVLATLVSTDIQARATPKRRPAILPMVERWLVVLALLAAIVLPLYTMPDLFPLPTTISPQAQAAFNTINTLPTDKPALVVFDYDPAQSGELNPSAAALVRHLLLRGIPVVGLSTRPAGAALGDALMNSVAMSLSVFESFSYTYGVNYISLGYLPGGPMGVAQFAANPHAAFFSDFRSEFAYDPDTKRSVWDAASALIPITSLNDFGGLIVIAATPDSARTWIEQAHPQAAVPMIAAVSAGVEPLLLPYADGDNPVLRGIVSGLPGATQYEAQAGFSHDTTAQSWTVLGGGLILGALPLLILGNIIASIVSLVRRRQQRRG